MRSVGPAFPHRNHGRAFAAARPQWIATRTVFGPVMAQATFYVTESPAFLVKITFIILGIANLHYTQKVLQREAANWDAAGAVPQLGMILAGCSLLFWTVSVVAGRLIAYL